GQKVDIFGLFGEFLTPPTQKSSGSAPDYRFLLWDRLVSYRWLAMTGLDNSLKNTTIIGNIDGGWVCL
ncbi:hypothetical protein KAX21_01340, partial [candidate division WOR-3 bacterium]|nr:hypothetical protein [candidate division WOR-3 bacterium]